MTFVGIFAFLALATLIARFQILPGGADPKVFGELDAGVATQSTLFVYVHGFERGRHWGPMREILAEHGSTLQIKYPFAGLSNADPLVVARRISEEIDRRARNGDYIRIVMIGQSMGALLAKRAFLEGEDAGMAWPAIVERVVLLAGMNRGWDISGQKPSDMGYGTYLSIWAGTWAARLAGIGNLILESETGAPFVANLRIDWIRRMANPDKRGLQVVQLLGDIDDIVSADDNNDLRAATNGRFAWIKVRGTGHPNIVDFADTTEVGNVTLGDYRRRKFMLATTELDFGKVEGENEMLPFQPDLSVTHVVFVVHGIRDLGEWAAAFEERLQTEFRSQAPGGANAKLAIASIRYGYFGMGPFLLRPVREKYVKWLMDEYTETIAQYPNARYVHFIGHSNGTYLLAAALQRYGSLDIGRVVFGGSVVRQDYRWDQVLSPNSADVPVQPELRVVNYTATDDWVVALFPRVFEPKFMAPLRNDIGSAGFNGFSIKNHEVLNIGGLTGGHAAFLDRIPEIATFILRGDDGSLRMNAAHAAGQSAKSLTSKLSSWGSSWATWIIVWPVLIFIVAFVGWHVVTAASEPRWPIFVGYVALLLMILRSV